MVRIVDLLEKLTRSSTNPGFRAAVSPSAPYATGPNPLRNTNYRCQAPSAPPLAFVFAAKTAGTR